MMVLAGNVYGHPVAIQFHDPCYVRSDLVVRCKPSTLGNMRFVTVDGITLHYALEGGFADAASGTPLVFVNSLGTDLRIWDGMLSSFAGTFPIIRYDKRGHGLSDAPAGPYTIGQHTDDLSALLGHLGVDEAIVVGISVGGMIALDFAARNSDTVSALVLCDTAAKIGTASGWNERIHSVREQGLGQMAETILARWFAPSFSRERPAEYRGYRNMLARSPRDGYVATCEALRDADLRESVSAIQANTLVLCGEEDPSTPPAVIRELAGRLPSAQFDVIPGAAHLPCIEQPAAMAARINRFLQENGYGQ